MNQILQQLDLSLFLEQLRAAIPVVRTYAILFLFVSLGLSVLCTLLGFRLRRVWSALTGAFLGASAGFWLNARFSLKAPYTFLAIAGCALLLGLILCLLWKAGMFLLCLVSVFLLLRTLLPTTDTARLLVYLAAGLLLAILSLVKDRQVLSVITAAVGGFSASLSFYAILNFQQPYLLTLLGIILTVIGILIQLQPWQEPEYWKLQDERRKLRTRAGKREKRIREKERRRYQDWEDVKEREAKADARAAKRREEAYAREAARQREESYDRDDRRRRRESAAQRNADDRAAYAAPNGRNRAEDARYADGRQVQAGDARYAYDLDGRYDDTYYDNARYGDNRNGQYGDVYYEDARYADGPSGPYSDAQYADNRNGQYDDACYDDARYADGRGGSSRGSEIPLTPNGNPDFSAIHSELSKEISAIYEEQEARSAAASSAAGIPGKAAQPVRAGSAGGRTAGVPAEAAGAYADGAGYADDTEDADNMTEIYDRLQRAADSGSRYDPWDENAGEDEDGIWL